MNQFSRIPILTSISGIHFLANESRSREIRMRKGARRILTACEWADLLDGLNDL